MATKPKRQAATFITTKEHRRFVEFASAVRKHRYIGLCFGAAGVGKTLSARRYTNWHSAEPLLMEWGPRKRSDAKICAALAQSRSLFYTPEVGASVNRLRRDLRELELRVNLCIDQHETSVDPEKEIDHLANNVELVIIDEAERLTTSALEFVRDFFDRSDFGLILIGMPGIEKRMSRYPQLYSRVGFAHHYRPLQADELSFVLKRHWRKLGLELSAADFTDAQAISTIARITAGNFRLLQRLFVQIERILRINELTVITDDVVNAARSTLVIGAT